MFWETVGGRRCDHGGRHRSGLLEMSQTTWPLWIGGRIVENNPHDFFSRPQEERTKQFLGSYLIRHSYSVEYMILMLQYIISNTPWLFFLELMELFSQFKIIFLWKSLNSSSSYLQVLSCALIQPAVNFLVNPLISSECYFFLVFINHQSRRARMLNQQGQGGCSQFLCLEGGSESEPLQRFLGFRICY